MLTLILAVRGEFTCYGMWQLSNMSSNDLAIDRRLLGDDAFWAGVKDYLTTFAGHVAETDDFRKCLEKHSGTNLTKFFDQWY